MEIKYKKIDLNKYKQWLIDNGFNRYETSTSGNIFYRKLINGHVFEFVVVEKFNKMDRKVFIYEWTTFFDSVMRDLMLIYNENEVKEIIESWYEDEV